MGDRELRWFRLIAVGLMILMSGCGADSPNMVEVRGTVLIDGMPLTTGSVITLPESGPGANGTISPQGEFELTTRQMGTGATIGRHLVGVVALEETQGLNPEAPRKSLIPRKYASPETSGLTIDVKPGDKNEVTLELSSRGD